MGKHNTVIPACAGIYKILSAIQKYLVDPVSGLRLSPGRRTRDDLFKSTELAEGLS
jgi:hypothetical protein